MGTRGGRRRWKRLAKEWVQAAFAGLFVIWLAGTVLSECDGGQPPYSPGEYEQR